MSKHAYMIVANGNFKVLETCLRMIDDDRNDVYLLIDSKAHVTPERVKYLSSCLSSSRLKVYQKMVNWGGTHR